MASTRSTVDFLLRQLGPEATANPMFGEYGLYFRGTLIGSVCDDRLFLKVTAAGASVIGEHTCDSPYPGAKPAIIVPEDLWGEAHVMRELATATATELVGTKSAVSRRAGGADARRAKSRTSRRR
jgi:TfoX/Sxy family transcriptional regulator of competence genes